LTVPPNSGDTHLVRGPGFSRRRLLFGAAASFLSGGLPSCRRSSGAGASSGPRLRVVSLSPSTTEALFAIGAGPFVVGRSRFCDYPPAATKLPAVGGFVDVSLEATLGLAPTLVVGARGPGGRAIVDALETRGIKTYFPQTESVEEIETMIRGLGERTQRVTEANALVARMANERKALFDAVAAVPRRRVLLLFGLSPIVGAGPLGFPHEMLTLSGCDNVLAHGEGRKTAYPTLSFEQVLAADPDLIVLTSAMGTDTSLPTPWQACRAVRTGQVVFLPGDEILRPGPRITKGQRRLIEAVHPTVVLPSVVSEPSETNP
jgi:iron complex transport system substrate-binding protein